MKTAKKAVKKTAKDDAKRENGLMATWREVSRKQKNLMIAMIILAVASSILLIFSLLNLRPQSTVVIVGYGDVYGEIAGISGGYRRSSWTAMLAFPILALIFGLVHNLLALRVYKKYGRDTALVVVVATIVLVVGSFAVLLRLMGEW